MKENNPQTLISIVVPVYRAENVLRELVDRITKAVGTFTDRFEIILVEDGSPDNSWSIIKNLSEDSPQIKGISLSRNFGQHYAITAGLELARGEWTVVMDCDLQDVPEEIPMLYQKAQEGWDIVVAVREYRQDNKRKRLFSYLFYKTLSYLTGVPYDHKVANFGIYHRKVLNAINKMGDTFRFFPAMVKWTGFKKLSIPVQHNSSTNEKSSYNFNKLLKLALDIILSYSDKPIRLTIKFGLLISLLAFLAAIIVFIRAIMGKIVVLGYPSLIISIWFLSGVIIVILGIVGLYVGKTFESVKNRPVYIIKDWVNV